MFDIILKKKQTDVISPSKVFDVLIYSFPNYILQRKEAGIFARVIQEQCKHTVELKKKDKSELRITRALAGLDLNSMTFIYGDNIAIIKLVNKGLMGVLIRDKMLADDQRGIFEILWSQAK